MQIKSGKISKATEFVCFSMSSFFIITYKKTYKLSIKFFIIFNLKQFKIMLQAVHCAASILYIYQLQLLHDSSTSTDKACNLQFHFAQFVDSPAFSMKIFYSLPCQ